MFIFCLHVESEPTKGMHELVFSSLSANEMVFENKEEFVACYQYQTFIS